MLFFNNNKKKPEEKFKEFRNKEEKLCDENKEENLCGIIEKLTHD